MTPQPLFIASLEYSPGKDLNGHDFYWVRLRVLVEGPGSLWTEDGATAANLVAEYLEPNEITIHGAPKATPHGLVARINVSETALSDFVEYTPTFSGVLSLRTFLNVCGTDKRTLFDSDNCWNSLILSGRSLQSWFEDLLSLKL